MLRYENVNNRGVKPLLQSFVKRKSCPRGSEEPGPATAGIQRSDVKPLFHRRLEAIDLRFELLDNLRIVVG